MGGWAKSTWSHFDLNQILNGQVSKNISMSSRRSVAMTSWSLSRPRNAFYPMSSSSLPLSLSSPALPWLIWFGLSIEEDGGRMIASKASRAGLLCSNAFTSMSTAGYLPARSTLMSHLSRSGWLPCGNHAEALIRYHATPAKESQNKVAPAWASR